MTSYSYKPASGLEGASTVVPLKDGGFLEVRRGSKTRWADGEERRVWETLDAWKATLPADAVVVERGKKLVPVTEFSADFKKAIKIYKENVSGGQEPWNVRLSYTNNALTAVSYRRSAARYMRIATELMSHHSSSTDTYKSLAELEIKQAEKALADPPFEYFYCKYAYSNENHLLRAIYAQRIKDNVFVPIFFDKDRGLLHTPESSHDTTGKAITGTTFAELGVSPVFLCRYDGGPIMRIITAM